MITCVRATCGPCANAFPADPCGLPLGVPARALSLLSFGRGGLTTADAADAPSVIVSEIISALMVVPYHLPFIDLLTGPSAAGARLYVRA